MKIYLSAKFERRPVIREVADKLWKLGYEIVGTWIHETAQPPFMDQATFYRKLALKDVAEVTLADLLILDTIEMSDRGGAATEFGIALAQYQTTLVWVVGPKRSVFHELADEVFETWDDCVEALRKDVTDEP